ncbi:MAG: LVIVD repeat-containing protein [Flavobacterium sp.]|uniref:LVIVD repeat-containing protein n=1 Tax=Flavobacterium sp. TaxID=239 RepID=UPI003BA473F8
MNTIKSFWLIAVCLFMFTACNDEEGNNETAKFAVPIVKTLSEIRNSITIESAQPTQSDGKIYVTQNLLFYVAQESGIHVFDNSNPQNPQNMIFINLEGVHDIAIKGNYLYADNFVDLVVFDISDLNNIFLVRTVENVLEFYPAYPEEAEFYSYDEYPGVNEIMVGFRIETRKKPDYNEMVLANDAFAILESSSGGTIGTGGSFAKFQINNNALYTVENFDLNVFNITNPEQTFFDKSIYMTEWMGGGIFETLFKQKEFLFIGSTNGMYIVNAFDEFNPYFVSGFSHATACDPVVVHANTAYITVRGGSTCGAIEDQINVIDITNIENPTLISTYLLNQPFGLGIRNNVLYVCADGNLNVFDATNSAELVLQNTYNDQVKDVIALDTHLIAVGTNKIVQYNYGDNHTLEVISTVNF